MLEIKIKGNNSEILWAILQILMYVNLYLFYDINLQNWFFTFLFLLFSLQFDGWKTDEKSFDVMLTSYEVRNVKIVFLQYCVLTLNECLPPTNTSDTRIWLYYVLKNYRKRI